MKHRLRQIVLESDSRQGKIFDLFIQSLIIISLITFSLETVKGKSQEYYRWLQTIEIITIVIFSLEYASAVSKGRELVDKN